MNGIINGLISNNKTQKHMSRVARKSDICLCKNKGADQLRSYYTDSTISLLLKFEIPSFMPASVTVRADFFGTWSETPKTGFSRVAAHIISVTHKKNCLLHIM